MPKKKHDYRKKNLKKAYAAYRKKREINGKGKLNITLFKNKHFNIWGMLFVRMSGSAINGYGQSK